MACDSACLFYFFFKRKRRPESKFECYCCFVHGLHNDNTMTFVRCPERAGFGGLVDGHLDLQNRRRFLRLM